MQVETAHDHTVTKSFSDYRPKRGAARKPKYEEEGDEDWSQIQRKTGGRGKKEEKTEVVPFAGEGERFLTSGLVCEMGSHSRIQGTVCWRDPRAKVG